MFVCLSLSYVISWREHSTMWWYSTLVKEMGFGVRETWMCVLALELYSHITVGKLLKLSLKMDKIIVAASYSCFEDCMQ